MKSLFTFNALLLAGCFLLLQFSVVTHPPVSTDFAPVLEGRMAEKMVIYDKPQQWPDISFQTIFEIDITPSDIKGQWTLINLWASWCPPCIVEMPSLQKLQNLRPDIKIIGISVDRNKTGKDIQNIMKKYKFGSVAGYYDRDNTLNRILSPKGLPTTYIVNPSGSIVARFEGDADWSDKDALAFIDSL